MDNQDDSTKEMTWSKPSYDNPISIAYLLGSEASNIASINNISTDTKVPSNKTIIVPILCSCSGNIYQHDTPYTAKKGDTYYHLVNETYQSLTTCQALKGQNYYASENITIGAELTVTVLCACPTTEQTAKGITSLLVYTVNYGETVKSIGKAYGVDEESILEANELQVAQSENSSAILYALTPILLPLRGKSCKEDPNSFYCTCSKGTVADGSCDESDDQKFPAKLVAALGVGIGAGFLILFLLGYKLYQYIKKMRADIRKENLFRQNGGYLLQEKLSSYGNGEMAKLFTAEEMQRSTDNYNQSRFLGQGGYGTVYKGMLQDGTIVAVQKSKQLDRNQIETFVNEVVTLSQINHRNIVKLIGCCLETETPLLVYEYIPNETLFQHIHRKDHDSTLSWESRLRIACEVAGAVAYMHFSASIPIFHRDIKPKLITGRTPITFNDEDEGQNMTANFISVMKDNQLSTILDDTVIKEARKEDILAIANLAVRCLRLDGKKRQTMKEVSAELEALRKVQNSLHIKDDQESPSDEQSSQHSSNGIFHESTVESFSLSSQMESTSF
ncbi:hypothetical protein P8452_60767 [Trifolium repens]|nr:hypothetical protein P8452_60767 [Trifolium repens]